MKANAAPQFQLDGNMDVANLAEGFAATGRIQIPNFLAEDAALRLRDELMKAHSWRHVVSAGATLYEIPSADFDAMPTAQREAIERALFAEATCGFRFQYDVIRVPDDRDAQVQGQDGLITFVRLMSASGTLDMMRRISGNHGVAFADGQATRYRTGDFLTRHDDDVAGKGRLLAYVLSLSEDWRPEWGGLLIFNDAHGGIVDIMVPKFNALCLFTVPQAHSVSYVAPYAGAARLSITGWLREAGEAIGFGGGRR